MKAKILVDMESPPIFAPVVIPDLAAVRLFANQCHQNGQPWQGVLYGWEALYQPEQPTPPLDSNLTFTPADFCLGDSHIWFYSLTWENGANQPPVEYVDNHNLLEPLS